MFISKILYCEMALHEKVKEWTILLAGSGLNGSQPGNSRFIKG
nr:hypothetical protein [uncultured Dyadobacter sp.]